MREWLARWSGEEVFWIALGGAIVLGLTVGGGLSISVASTGVGATLGPIMQTIHVVLGEYWLAAFPILGLAGFRFVTLARD